MGGYKGYINDNNSDMVNEKLGQFDLLPDEYIEGRIFEIIKNGNFPDKDDFKTPPKPLMDIVKEFKMAFDKCSLGEAFDTGERLCLLDYIESQKYSMICINVRTLLAASLVNGFTMKLISDLLRAVDYKNPVESADYLDFSNENKDLKDLLMLFIRGDEKVEVNKHRLFAKIFVENTGAVVRYNSVIKGDTLTVINKGVKLSESIVWRDMYYDDRNIRYVKGSKDDTRLNIYDSGVLLGFFILWCGEYDSERYPLGKYKGTVRKYNDFETRRYSESKYLDLIKQVAKLYSFESENENICISDSVKAGLIAQKVILNKWFGIHKLYSMYRHYGFLTSDAVVKALGELFDVSDQKEVKRIIENNVFYNDAVYKILRSEYDDPLLYFEYYFMLQIWDTRTFRILNDKIISFDLEETIRNAMNNMYLKLKTSNSRQKTSNTLNHDDYSYLMNTIISQECEVCEDGSIDVEKSEKKILYKLENNKFYKKYYCFDDDEKYSRFIREVLNYEVISKYILENIEKQTNDKIENINKSVDFIVNPDEMPDYPRIRVSVSGGTFNIPKIQRWVLSEKAKVTKEKETDLYEAEVKVKAIQGDTETIVFIYIKSSDTVRYTVSTGSILDGSEDVQVIEEYKSFEHTRKSDYYLFFKIADRMIRELKKEY